jgi:hypothetical protein
VTRVLHVHVRVMGCGVAGGCARRWGGGRKRERERERERKDEYREERAGQVVPTEIIHNVATISHMNK